MRFTSILAMVAGIALLGNEVEARRKPSKYSVQRTMDVRHNLERVYGKGLVGMINEKTGRVDQTRFGWDNRATGGARMGSGRKAGLVAQTISRTIMPGLTIDASTSSAFWLGFAKGLQYEGLSKDDEADNLPGAQVVLTNCFASTYSYMSTLDTAAFNRQHISGLEEGSNKYLDVLLLDPTHILTDLVVNYEMCEVGMIVDQFKGMASLDWAAVADNLSREALVLFMEMPNATEQMANLANAAECTAKAAEKAAKRAQEAAERQAEAAQAEHAGNQKWEEFPSDIPADQQGDPTTWNFQADVAGDATAEAAALADETAAEIAACFSSVDQYAIGEIGGKLFVSFFNNELKPLV